MKKIYLSCFILLVVNLYILIPGKAQNPSMEYSVSEIADSVPRVFMRGTISSLEYLESDICFSPSGTEIYFTRKETNRKGEPVSNIYTTVYNGQEWKSPLKASFNSGYNDEHPSFSPDGKSVYFLSERRKPGISSFIGEIWIAKRKSNKWFYPGYPENILNRSWIKSVSITRDNQLFFSSYRKKQIGIFSSVLSDDNISEPVFLPKEINSVAGASNPYITPEGDILVFTGKTKGYDYTELFISFRTSAGLWEPAQKLNRNINLTHTENNPYISPDGKYLFFSRSGDIYWIRIEYIF